MKKLISLLLALLTCAALLPAVSAAKADETAYAKREGETTVVSDEPLREGDNTFAVGAGEFLLRPFTPTRDGLYRIYSSCTDHDPVGSVLDADMLCFDEDGDNGPNRNFLLFEEFYAGETYYIGVRLYGEDCGATVPVTIQWAPFDACGDHLTWSFDEDTGTLTVEGSGDMWDTGWENGPWCDRVGAIRHVVLPNGITSIGACVFASAEDLEDINFPDGLKRIGHDAFNEAGSLKAAELPESVTVIEDGAFASCDSLRGISAPGVKVIGAFAFAYSGLESFYIEACTESIGRGAFSYCRSLRPESFDMDPGNTHYLIDDGVLLTKDEKTLHTYLCAKRQNVFYTPDHVTDILDYAFGGAGNLVSVMLQDPVRIIGSYAFADCSNLEDVTIPLNVASIEEGAFLFCYKLKDVYYLGTEGERNEELTVCEDMGFNDDLLNATWHYLDKPAFEGTIEWNPDDLQFNGNTPYVIADGTPKTPRFTVREKDGSVVPPAEYTFEYRENTEAGTGYVIVRFKGTYAGKTKAFFKIYLPKTATTTVANVSDGVKVSWKAVPGAAGYVVYRRAWSGTTNGWTAFQRWNNTTATTWTDTKVFAGTRYQYGVKAYFAKRTDPVTGASIGGAMDNYNLGAVGPLKTTVRITTRTLNGVTPGTKQLTVKWSGSSNFTGYQVQIATDTAFTKDRKTVTIGNPKTYQTTIKSLKANTTYYVRVRSYHVFEGTTYYGGWSNVMNAKTK